ncbi:peptidoglycan amidohydrolase family protein [Streptococcus agalactiae]|uniref:peptidoglycan amidohydrolase family protein n=1 Tax=Streptococcus agalactiae TaxID=1311 RepID=UPI00215AD284|nr:peptidoglycan amidohydrolase family protein [Streptococcus agalactiae]
MLARDGASSYDCSSSIYYALRSAGASNNGWAVNTEYEHDWLIKNGYQLVAENELLYPQRGDIGIWGKRGYSAGAGGHTFMFIDESNIIHCNYGYNGITVNDYNEIWYANGHLMSIFTDMLANNQIPRLTTKQSSHNSKKS